MFLKTLQGTHLCATPSSCTAVLRVASQGCWKLGAPHRVAETWAPACFFKSWTNITLEAAEHRPKERSLRFHFPFILVIQPAVQDAIQQSFSLCKKMLILFRCFHTCINPHSFNWKAIISVYLSVKNRINIPMTESPFFSYLFFFFLL